MKPTIGKIEGGKNLVIDIKRLLVTRMLVQASSGGGKSYALRRILEQTANHVQQVILDIEDEFTTLREKFDYVICAPQGADAIATPQTATILARRLRETRASAIIGMYEMKMPDRKKFVRLFLEEFVEAPKSMWHPCLVVVDEAHHFCPEKDEAESMSAVNDLITRGRKRGLCGLLATQRLSKLSKDSAAELHNKLIGLAVLDTDVKRASDDLGMTMKEAMPLLRSLEPGEFFCFGPALTRTVTKIKVGSVVTTHPEAGAGKILAPPPPSSKIKALLAKLTDLPKEAEQEARTLSDFKAENTRLKRELTTVQRQTDPAVIERAVKQERQKIEDGTKGSNLKLQRQYERLKAFAEEAMQFIVKITADETLLKEGIDPETVEKAMKKAVDEIRKQVDARFESQRRLLENYRRQGARMFKDMESFLDGARVPIDVNVSKQEPIVAKVMPHASIPRGNSGDGTLPTPQQRIIDAIAWMESVGITESETTAVAFLAGYTVGGGAFNNPKGTLRTAGLIEYRGSKLVLTEEGRNLANIPDAVLTSGALHDRILERLPTPERKLMTVALEVYPEDIADTELAERAGYAVGGGAFNNPKGRLRTLGLVTYPSSKRVRASDILFID